MSATILECPECHHRYPSDFSYCIDDGSYLVKATQTQTSEAIATGSWLEALRTEADRMIRGRLIVLNEAELKASEEFFKTWQLLPETYLRVDLLRFGPTEILQTLSEMSEIFENPSLYLCFLKRCLNLKTQPAFLENLPKPLFDSGLYIYLQLMLKWKKIQTTEISEYQNHNDYSIRELIINLGALSSSQPAPLRIVTPTSVKLQVS